MEKIQGWRLDPSFAMSDVFVHILVWTVLSVVTLGIALVFWPYASAKLVLNAVEIIDSEGRRVGKLRCQLGVGTQIGHALLWYILSVITLGFALPFMSSAWPARPFNKLL